jgi:hypothetical protein
LIEAPSFTTDSSSDQNFHRIPQPCNLTNVLVSALALAPFAAANFHIVHAEDGWGKGARDYFTMAMPSNRK